MNDTMKSCYQQLNTFVDHYLDALRLVLEEKNDLELTEHAVASVRWTENWETDTDRPFSLNLSVRFEKKHRIINEIMSFSSIVSRSSATTTTTPIKPSQGAEGSFIGIFLSI